MEEKEEFFKSPHLGAGPGLIKVKGMWFPLIYLKMDPNKMDKIETFQAKPEDIWLCSYPKSGTSWLQQIVYLLVKGIDNEDAHTQNSDQRFPYLEGIVPMVDKLTETPGQRFIKTHLPIDVLPKSLLPSKAKVIYVARNVKDVSVSMYHFHQLVTNIDYKGSFQDFYSEFLQGKVCYDKWWEHVSGFWKHKDAENMLFITYEDMHQDSINEIKKIADFLNIKYEDALLEKIAESALFSNMKDDPKANQSWQVERGIYKKEPGKNFMRKGKVGDWKNYYTEDMSKEVDSVCEETIKPLGLEFNYEV